MTEVGITVQGVSPLLMNRFHEGINLSGTSAAIKTGDRGTPREQATPRAYIGPDGNLSIPGTILMSAIIAAGKFHKSGRSKLTTQKTSIIPAGIFITTEHASLNTSEWEVDSRTVVVPATGGRIMCHRPRIDSWSVSFMLEYDEDMFSQSLVRKLVDDAGSKMGVMSYRPSCKGPFGRFVVTKWDCKSNGTEPPASDGIPI